MSTFGGSGRFVNYHRGTFERSFGSEPISWTWELLELQVGAEPLALQGHSQQEKYYVVSHQFAPWDVQLARPRPLHLEYDLLAIIALNRVWPARRALHGGIAKYVICALNSIV